MPRVSAEHLEARRRQIMAAARRCVGRKGFHSVSVQDVLDESGLSAGAVYRYFSSKEELVTAVADEVLDSVRLTFERSLTRHPLPPLSDLVAEVFSQGAPMDATPESCRLMLRFWAAAADEEALGSRLAGMLAQVRALFAETVHAYQERGLVTRDADPTAIADVLIGVVHGFIVRAAFTEDTTVDSLRAGLRALAG
ncbi:TetR/AcrR family transcriptional regulator [Streptosporangium sp. CA-135522]|uniref:TetR/AcrR family transcriptional regulator n=1 Tax=Streptosporangium sp. CA-135522 TaxID=3240072 RepID=UPI003D905B5F